MSRALLVACALLAAAPAPALEKLGVIAVGEAPGGPDPDVTELAHQLRAACRDRIGGVEEVATMRARLTGRLSGATVSELDRAYGGALAVFQNGEFESAFRTLGAIVDDLEGLPESDDVYFQWTRALVRYAHTANAIERKKDMEAAFAKLARTDVTYQVDADQYAPSFRRKYDEVRARVKTLPRQRLTVLAEGPPGTVYLNGRNMGQTPLSLTLPAGEYRVGGAAGGLRVPTFTVDLRGEDRTVVLDFALADAIRINAGPGLALPAAQRAYGIVRAGAWLGVDRLIVVGRVQEGQAPFLLGSMYDVRRGALLREGSVRMVAGSVPGANLAALAAFLIHGQSSREVKDRTVDGPKEIVPPAVALSPLPAAIAPAPAAPPPAPASPAAAPLATPGREPAASAPAAPTAPQAATPAAALAAAPAARTTRPAQGKPEREAAAATTPAALSPASVPAPANTPAPAPAVVPAPPTARAASLAATLPPPGTNASPLDAAGGAAPRARAGWIRPAALGSGGAALGLVALAVQQKLAASAAYADADALLNPDGTFKAGAQPARYRALRAEGDAAMRNAYVSTGAAVVFGAAAGYLGWKGWSVDPASGALAYAF